MSTPKTGPMKETERIQAPGGPGSPCDELAKDEANYARSERKIEHEGVAGAAISGCSRSRQHHHRWTRNGSERRGDSRRDRYRYARHYQS